MDGFSAFFGALGFAGLALMLYLAGTIAVLNFKREAVTLGYFEVGGSYFSVKPAAKIRAE